MAARLATLLARFQSEHGPLPPSAATAAPDAPSLPSSSASAAGDCQCPPGWHWEEAEASSLCSSGAAAAAAADIVPVGGAAGGGSGAGGCVADGCVVEAGMAEAEAALQQHSLGVVPAGHEEAALMDPDSHAGSQQPRRRR
jgi:hypothetical protein